MHNMHSLGMSVSGITRYVTHERSSGLDMERPRIHHREAGDNRQFDLED